MKPETAQVRCPLCQEVIVVPVDVFRKRIRCYECEQSFDLLFRHLVTGNDDEEETCSPA